MITKAVQAGCAGATAPGGAASIVKANSESHDMQRLFIAIRVLWCVRQALPL